MEDGAREDEDGAVEDGAREKRAVEDGRRREDGDEAWEDGGIYVREEREGGRFPVAFLDRAREGHNGVVAEVPVRKWSLLSWKTLLIVTASLGIGILLFMLYKQHKRIKALEEVMAVTDINVKTKSVAKLNGSIAALEQVVDKHRVWKGRMESSINAVNTAVNDINGMLATTSSKIDGLKKATNDINGKLATTSSKIDGLKKATNDINGKLATTSSKIDGLKKATNDIHANLLNTQRFVVDMAQRQKWPWPFNNRVKGLEEEFGLPKQ